MARINPARIRVLEEQLRDEAASIAATEAQLKQLKLRQSEEPPQPSPPLAPPAAPRGEDKGQLQIDELFRALEAATKAKGAHTRTDNDLIAENRRLREEVRKLKSSNESTRQGTPHANVSRRPSIASATSSGTNGQLTALARQRQETEDQWVQDQAAEQDAAWIDAPPWGMQGGPMPSAQWTTTAQSAFKPVPKQFLVPSGRSTARVRSSAAMARRADMQRLAAEVVSSEWSGDWVSSGGKTRSQRYWDLHPEFCMPHELARQMQREAAYSDVYQVRPPVGPGGYVRESQYRHQQGKPANYKMEGLQSGDTRPAWNVTW